MLRIALTPHPRNNKALTLYSFQAFKPFNMLSSTVFKEPECSGYESDEPTAEERAYWAAFTAPFLARRGQIVDGRDWAGVLVEVPTEPSSLVLEAEELCRKQEEDYRLCERLFGSEVAEMNRSDKWYDALYPDGDAEWDAAVEAYKACKSEVDRKDGLKVLSYTQNLIADKVAFEARRTLKRGDVVEKNGRLCTRLYSCVGDKASGGAKPSTLHVSSECWSHERTDPLTGQRIVKHVCPFLHPGEPGWHNEWLTNRLWTPPAAPTRTWTPDNRFAAAASSDGWQSSNPKRGGGGGGGGGGKRGGGGRW